MNEATSHTLNILSAIDPLFVGASRHKPVMACFILADGTRIWYKPERAGGPWKPITETCGRGDDNPYEDEQPLVREEKE